ncbi:MAG TPA: hypothetical protein PK280_04700 [Planctomycetota bacterium]|nr:hypothetical protein [Planctomycetota bacterium]
MKPLRSALVLAALLALAGCSRGEEAAEAKPAGQPPPAPAPAPVAPDPELEALGLKVFGKHEHKWKHSEPHYRLELGRDWLDEGSPAPSEEKLGEMRRMPGVVSVEVKDGILPYTKKPGKYVLVTKLIDLWSEADVNAWKKETAEKYMILADVGRTKWAKGYSADRRPWYVGADRPDEQVIDICVMYMTKDGSYAKAWVYAVEEPSVIFRHEFDNLVIRGGRSDATRKTEGGHVYEVQDHAGNREGAVWLSGERVVVKVAGDEYPAELIEGYLKKYPSALDNASRIDFGRWAAEEFALRLRRIDEAADRLAAGKKQRISVYDELTALRTRFPIQVEGYSQSKDFDSPEKLRALRKQLGDWWAANKDKLRWNPKIRGFEAGE